VLLSFKKKIFCGIITAKTRNERSSIADCTRGSPHVRRRSAAVVVTTKKTCNIRRSIADCIVRPPYLPLTVGDDRRAVDTTNMFLQ
jgi:hypothetical protein